MNPSRPRLLAAFTGLLAVMSCCRPAMTASPEARREATSERQATDVPQIEPKLLEELRELDARLAKIADLQADFVQLKRVALLKAPLRSQGTLIVKGSRTRWDTVKPRPSTTLTTPKEIRIHFPEQKVVEVYRVDERMSSMLMSPLPRLDALRESFHITREKKAGDSTDDALTILLSPRGEELKKHLKSVHVRIDRKSAVATRLEMVDVDGDVTTYELSNIKLNGEIEDKAFELKLPAGTRIIRPLEGDPDRKRKE